MKQFVTVGMLISVFAVTSVVAGEKEDIARIKVVVAKEMKGAIPTSINRTPIAGLYEVMVPPRIFYLSGDARYAFNGDILDLEKDVNISEQQRGKARRTILNSLDESQMIVFAPKDVKYTVSAFTDIDCGYCRKLHSEIKQYNDLGIKIRYLSFPRAGIGSDSYKKAVTVWCSADRKQAITDAKAGKSLPEKDCPNPVAQQYQLGQMLGVSGTPTLIFPDGQVLPGYVPPKKLLEMLERHASQKAN